jgi:alpha-glucosidase (family GH31 glycosyl hydrolase)
LFIASAASCCLAGAGPQGAASIDLGGILAQAAKSAHATSVVEGQVRFEVLAPALVRLEYSAASRFIDLPSQSVVKRDWPTATPQTRREGGWLEIDTGKMTVRYRLGAGAFTAANLEVRWKDEQGAHTWKPGDKDNANLGGVRTADIAWRTEPVADPGPLSRNGYFFLDDSHTAVWDPAAQWVRPRGDDKGDQDWYFFVYGHHYLQMLSQLAELLGPVPMVPRYILGTWVGARAGYSAEEWKMNGNELREKHVPADLFVLDSDSMSKVTWAGYDEDPVQMPDPRGFFHWALENGFHVTTNEHYGALTPEADRHFDEMRRIMGLPPDAQEIRHDLANKTYAGAFMELLHRPRLDMGMAFWWQDGWADAKMAGLDPALWTRHVEYEGSEQITGRRAFDFCRLGAWGSHRYGGFFTGDLIPYWSTLDLLVPFHVQSSNMLVDYVISLSSGVFQETVDPELYQRWVEFSAFSPVFWWHGLWGLRLPWEYGDEGLATTRKFLQLRYRLIPYMYTYARLAHDTGAPLVRGTFLDYPGQEGSYTYRRQFMFGRELLAAPVTEPGYGRPVLKDIYLPAGEKWIDFFTGRIYDGGQTIAYSCPLDRLPLFARAGSIVPLAPDMEYTGQRPVDPLTVDVYAGKPASFRLYEDDGVSLDYRHGGYAWTPLGLSEEADGRQRLEIGPSDGQYNGQPKVRRYTVRVHGLLKPHAVLLNGRELPEARPAECGEGCGGWVWDDQTRVSTIRTTEATPVNKKTTITLEGAGAFADAEVLQKMLDYRERIRRVKEVEKLKWGLVLHGLDFSRPPRVMRETEAVEAELDGLISKPQGIGRRPPDFRALTARVLRAFSDQPFESNRPLPKGNTDALKAAPLLAQAHFEPEELRRMTVELLGCRLFTKAWGTPSPVIDAKLACDSEALGAARVTYDIVLPEEGLPGWIEEGPPLEAESGYTRFRIRAPFPPHRGEYRLRVKALLAWQGGEAEVVRDVEWTSAGGHLVPTDNGFSFPDLMPTYRNGIISDVEKK